MPALIFEPRVPFPVIDESVHSYAEAQAHAAAVDSWLGLKVDEVEKGLAEHGCRSRAPQPSGEKQELWIGLASKSLLTPYTEIRGLLEKLNLQPGSRIADLGAGYGRIGFVVGRHYPHVHFMGYEYVGERVREGRRCLALQNFHNVHLCHADLTSKEFQLPEADFYFIYDFGTPHAISKVVHDLKKAALTRPITVIGRGRSSRDVIEREHPWLSQVVDPRHFGHYSLYRSAATGP